MKLRQPLFRKYLSVLTGLISLTLVLATLLGACSSTPPKDETIGWSPNKLFAEAMDERNSRNYDKAVSHFEKLEGRAAGTVLSQQAQLEKAYTHHVAGEQAQAIATSVASGAVAANGTRFANCSSIFANLVTFQGGCVQGTTTGFENLMTVPIATEVAPVPILSTDPSLMPAMLAGLTA